MDSKITCVTTDRVNIGDSVIVGGIVWRVARRRVVAGEEITLFLKRKSDFTSYSGSHVDVIMGGK